MRSGDLNRAEAMLKADTALDANCVGSQVLESDSWITSKDSVMWETLEAKLHQCIKSRDALCNTRKRTSLWNPRGMCTGAVG
jgi:predicted NAD-dependent protein-ADP-ribosyltransferase YbiA (DUF1768 family)